MQTDINNNILENPIKMVNEQELSSNNLKRRLEQTDILDSSQSDCKQSMYETKKYHRLIEKRRRDRINECIYQLKDLLPGDLRRSTNKPMEKAVILELVVEYMQTLAQQRTENEAVGATDFMLGYKACQNQACSFLGSKSDINQDNMIEYLDIALPKCLLDLKKRMKEEKGRRLDSGSESGSSSYEQDMPAMENSKQSQVSSSSSHSSLSSSLSSSPISDRSLPTENSDSSGSDNQQQKVHKRKVFSHHRSSTASSHSRLEMQPVFSATSNAMNSNLPVFINMPFVMNPGMIPAASYMNGDQSNGSSPTPMPCLIKPSNMQMQPGVRVPGGLVMPQMTQDNSSAVQVSGGMMPTFLVAGPTMQQIEPLTPRPDDADKKPQGLPSESVLIQPTMVMPVQNQAGFICMPSFTMAQQYPTPPLTS